MYRMFEQVPKKELRIVTKDINFIRFFINVSSIRWTGNTKKQNPMSYQLIQLNNQSKHQQNSIFDWVGDLSCVDLNNELQSNDLMIKQSRQRLEQQRAVSKGTFKTNSEQSIINGSFEFQCAKTSTNPACSFCLYKPVIINKLKILKEIIVQKNEKISELQCIIFNITNVALGEESELQPRSEAKQSKCQGYQGKLQEFEQMSFSQNKYVKQAENKENRPYSLPKIPHRDFSLVSSQVKSELQAKQLTNMRVQIKNQIKNMNLQLDKSLVEEKSGTRKEFGLKKKLIQIINVLPKMNSGQLLKQFQTLSQPQCQGITGLINSKVSNYKKVKNVGFLKKNEYQEHFSQKTVTSQMSQSFKSQKSK